MYIISLEIKKGYFFLNFEYAIVPQLYMVWFDAKRTYVYFGDTLGLLSGITFSMYHTIKLWIVDSATKYTLLCQYKIKKGSCILVLLFDSQMSMLKITFHS